MKSCRPSEVLLLVDATNNLIPRLAAKIIHSLLVRLEIVGLVLVSHFEDFMGRVPVLRHADEMVTIEIDGGHMLAV